MTMQAVLSITYRLLSVAEYFPLSMENMVSFSSTHKTEWLTSVYRFYKSQ